MKKKSGEKMIIGISGATGSGKTTFANEILKKLQESSPQFRCGILSMDDFYRELSEHDHQAALKSAYNFDCLEAFDLDGFYLAIENAKTGKAVSFFAYDHSTHKHDLKQRIVKGPYDIWIVEGLYLLSIDEDILSRNFNLRISMEIDLDTCLLRRIRRDMMQRDRDIEGILQQYERFVKPAYHDIVLPAKRKHADILVTRGADNIAASNSIISFIIANNP